MDYQLKVNDQEDVQKVQITSTDQGTWAATIGDREYTVQCRRLGPHHLYTEINGRSVHLFVASDKSVKHMIIGGVPYTVEDASTRRRKGGGGDKGGVTPPMPGTIMRVLVEAGDAVEEGQELLVMSAMKMETTLYAPKPSTIQKVLVAEGDQVAAGQQLFEFEALEEDGESA